MEGIREERRKRVGRGILKGNGRDPGNRMDPEAGISVASTVQRRNTLMRERAR
jgi:hypothetical protein